MDKIGILGCGWLGKPLGKKLVGKGLKVCGTTTQTKNFEAIRALGLEPFKVQLKENKIDGQIDGFLKGLKSLIIAIPPGLRRKPSTDFVKKFKHLSQKLKEVNIDTVIFISSTSVFENGPEISQYFETTPPNSNQENGKQLAQTEELAKNLGYKNSIVLRFGGLLGHDRHPVTYFAGKKGISNPKAPVNLIYQDDAVSLIEHILKTDIPSGHSIFHGVYPDHPSREEFYSKAAQNRGLEVPIFSHDNPSLGKTISSAQSSNHLEFTFDHQID